MSDFIHAFQESPQPRKRRRPNFKACDTCHHKKGETSLYVFRARCFRCKLRAKCAPFLGDGPGMPGKECSFCIEHGIECTYTDGKPKISHSFSYYRNRAEKLEGLIRVIVPDMDINAELEKLEAQGSDYSWVSEPSTSNPTTSEGGPNPKTPANTTVQSKSSAKHDGILVPDDFCKMHSYPARFHGKSSGVLLIQHAMKIRTEKTGVPENISSLLHNKDIAKLWAEQPWEHEVYAKKPPTFYMFPDEDLLLKLVDIYLSDFNVFCPLFHRPTLEQCVSDKLYLRDDSFGAVVLLLCANASRKCDDPRVLPLNSPSSVKGWQWFEQVRIHGQSFITAATLQELQTYILIAQYMGPALSPQGAWMLMGLALRAAQDVGAHRQKMYASPLTIEKELWRRAWWIMIRMDRGLASSLGRPLAIPDEEFDVELPIECDEEYWEHPDPLQAWKQPTGKPATDSHFVQLLKLTRILAKALRTVYADDKVNTYQDLDGEDWESRVVAELDSSLNSWISSLPDHLRWNPQCENTLWFRQSITLHAEYYLLQILIHMPFITTKKSPLSFPSLAICTNAARACSHLVDLKNPRLQHGMPSIVWPMFISAIVLLLNVWGGKKAGLEMDFTRALKDIRACQEVMMRCEERFKYVARRLWHILQLFTSDLHLQNRSAPNNKRARDGVPGSVVTTTSAEEESDQPPADRPSDDLADLAAGVGRISLGAVHESLLQSHFRTLPLFTNELERVPLFPAPSIPSPSDPQLRLHDNAQITFGDGSLPVMPPQSDDDQARSFSQAMQQLPFFDGHTDWGSNVFGDMPGDASGTGEPGMPFYFDTSTSGPTSYRGQQPLRHEDPTSAAGWQQASQSLRQNNWEAYISNVSELLSDIDSWGQPSSQQ